MNPNILSVILYGSKARNDNDTKSDLDICVFTKDRGETETNLTENIDFLFDLHHEEFTPTFYPEPVVDSMLEHGSLFLWHLRLEGKVLYGEEYFTAKLASLNSFKSHKDEILYHSLLFSDLLKSWHSVSIINEFDLSILFTISRNTCMVLSHRFGKPSFGRIDSFITAKKMFPDMPMTLEQYMHLSNWKIVYERDADKKLPLPRPKEYKQLLTITEGLLSYALSKT